MSLSIPGLADLELTDDQLLALRGQPVKSGIDPFSRRILKLICESGPYHSSVTLAADLGTSMFLEDALDELNTDGYIVYGLTTITDVRKARPGGGVGAITREIPSRIRATEKGFTAAGFRPRIKVVGPRRYDYGYKPPKGVWVDYTRFWHHAFTAVGGEIEREPILTHLVRFPTHRHEVDVDLIRGSGRLELNTFLTALGFTDDERAALLRRATSEASVEMIVAELTNAYQKRQAKSAEHAASGPPLTDVPLKAAVLEMLFRLNVQPGINSETLLEKLKHADVHTNINDLNATIWSLQKQQEVRFNESHGSGGSQLKRVRLTDKGRAHARQLRGEPIDGPVEHVSPPRPAPEVVPSPPEGFYKAPPLPEPPRQNEKAGSRVIDESDRVSPEAQGSSAEAQVPPAEAQVVGKDANGDTPTQYPEYSQGVSGDGSIGGNARLAPAYIESKWPPIREVIFKRRRLEEVTKKANILFEAAAAVEEVDREEAERLMDKARAMLGDPLSPLEIAVLELVDELR